MCPQWTQRAAFTKHTIPPALRICWISLPSILLFIYLHILIRLSIACTAAPDLTRRGVKGSTRHPAITAAFLIRLIRGERPVSELARALETSWPSAQRLEDPKHWPSLRQLEKAASALGKRLVLSFE
jgi:hypothetical protein